jgi:hypothetical protein
MTNVNEVKPTVVKGIGGGSAYLTGKLEDTIPLVFRETGLLFQCVDVGKRPVLAERKDQ